MVKITKKEKEILLWAHEAIEDFNEENPDNQFEGKDLSLPLVEGNTLRVEDGRDYTEYLVDLKYRLLEHYKDISDDAFGGTPRYFREVARAKSLYEKVEFGVKNPSQT